MSYVVNGTQEHNLYVEVTQGFLTLRKRNNPHFRIEVHFSREELLQLLGENSKRYRMEMGKNEIEVDNSEYDDYDDDYDDDYESDVINSQLTLTGEE